MRLPFAAQAADGRRRWRARSCGSAPATCAGCTASPAWSPTSAPLLLTTPCPGAAPTRLAC
eukprot:scaffold89413_cov66-Phaeocystis_antarctica.AAC.8